MEFGICLHSLIPVKGEPSHQSEMLTQLLFGELYRVVEKARRWNRVQLVFDNYEGWIHTLQCHFIGEDEFIRLNDAPAGYATDLVQLVMNETTGALLPVLLGSSLPGIVSSRFSISGSEFLYDGSVADPWSNKGLPVRVETQKIRNSLVANAKLYLHAPYLWGGRSPFGIDCSGFVQMLYKLENIKPLRDAGQQATQGEVISLLAESEPGDLVFFDDQEGNINHVGLICEPNRVIHCSGKVRTDALDHEGIYNGDLQKYTHKLRLIKRVI